jgi:hypothetical protein
MATRRTAPATDSLQAERERRRHEDNLPEPPEDLSPKLTKLERQAWEQVMASRSRWQEVDLRVAWRYCKAETELHRLQREMAKAPALVANRFGDQVEHPLRELVRKQQKVVDDQLRLLGLNTRPVDSRAASSAGRGVSGRGDRSGSGKPRGLVARPGESGSVLGFVK